MKKYKRYNQAFKDKAVKMSRERNNMLSVARELGVSYSTIRRWRKELMEGENGSAPRKNRKQYGDTAAADLIFWWYMHWFF